MSRLIDIAAELDRVFFDLEIAEGELTPELEERLNLTQAAFEDKVDGMIFYIKKLKNDSKLLKDEATKFVNKAVSLNDRSDYILNQLLKPILERTIGRNDKGQLKYKTLKSSIYTKRTQAIEIDDIDSIPDDYLSYKIELANFDAEAVAEFKHDHEDWDYKLIPKADKKGIKAYLNESEEHAVDGAMLINNESIIIK